MDQAIALGIVMGPQSRIFRSDSLSKNRLMYSDKCQIIGRTSHMVQQSSRTYVEHSLALHRGGGAVVGDRVGENVGLGVGAFEGWVVVGEAEGSSRQQRVPYKANMAEHMGGNDARKVEAPA